MKNRACNPSMLSDVSNYQNDKQVTQSGAYKQSKHDLKSQKTIAGTFKDPTECTFAPNDDQNGAKVAPQDPQMPPK